MRASILPTATTADDYAGHGTHVAGIAAAGTNNGIGTAGLGYNSSIMNVKVMGDTGSWRLFLDCQGIIWATDNGAKVINMSLGGSSASSTLESAINYAWSKGVIVVASAGNSGLRHPIIPLTTIMLSLWQLLIPPINLHHGQLMETG